MTPRFEYAPAPESRAVVDIASSYGLFIGGEFVDPADSTSFKTINPATEETLADVSEASAADVDKAVRAARRAYERTWSRMSGAERGKYLFRIARILAERGREFAVLETLDNGKPIKESRDVDIPTAAAHFFYHAGWADKLEYAGLVGPASVAGTSQSATPFGIAANEPDPPSPPPGPSPDIQRPMNPAPTQTAPPRHRRHIDSDPNLH